ncbi:MAG: RNA polymerase sigma-70 factor [Calditrichaeota bacterium]|nr:MAG: RNA polymerase sigma-70 factor [Calditrichota bacterium]
MSSSAEQEHSPRNDRQLVEAIREGDYEAFRELYFRYYQKLYNFIWYRTRADELTKDLIQELFVRVWHRHETLDPDRSIKAYLYRIANNLLINHLQKESVINAYRADQLHKPAHTLPEDDRFEVKDRIQEAINDLPEKQRLVFILHRFQDFTYAEIAEALNISIKTVEKRMSQALAYLRERLAPFR